MAAVIRAGGVYTLFCCSINHTADAETQGHLQVVGRTRVMRNAVLFAALPLRWVWGWGWSRK